MIPNEGKEKWHYLAVKKLSAFLYVIISNHKCDFYRLDCLRSFKTENWGYSMSSIWAFNNIENKHTLYLGEDCMKNFALL